MFLQGFKRIFVENFILSNATLTKSRRMQYPEKAYSSPFALILSRSIRFFDIFYVEFIKNNKNIIKNV